MDRVAAKMQKLLYERSYCSIHGVYLSLQGITLQNASS